MHITNISDAKTHLSALIEKVVAGEEVIIGKAGKPVAKLIRYERSTEPRRPGARKGKIKEERGEVHWWAISRIALAAISISSNVLK